MGAHDSHGIVMTRRSNRHHMTVMTPLSSGVQPRARAQSAGGRPALAWGRALRLQRRAAPTHTAHAAEHAAVARMASVPPHTCA